MLHTSTQAHIKHKNEMKKKQKPGNLNVTEMSQCVTLPTQQRGTCTSVFCIICDSLQDGQFFSI